jgi:hypothetical protein
MVPKLVQEDSMTFLIQIVMLFLAGSDQEQPGNEMPAN